MSTLGELKADVASELQEGYTSADTEIATAIDRAIAHWRDQDLYFNEETDATSIATVADQQAYSLPADLVKLLLVQITVSGTKHPIDPIDPIDYETLQIWDGLGGNTSAYPRYYAVFNKQLYLYPRPNAAYTITLQIKARLGAPADDGSENGWTTDAEELIRNTAKAKICQDILEDDERAAKFWAIASDQIKKLIRETEKYRSGHGRVKRRQF